MSEQEFTGTDNRRDSVSALSRKRNRCLPNKSETSRRLDLQSVCLAMEMENRFVSLVPPYQNFQKILVKFYKNLMVL